MLLWLPSRGWKFGIGDALPGHVNTHQTSARAIRKGMARVSASFGDSPRHDAVITVDRHGNTASTTHTVALVEELEAGHIQPGETIALIAPASGLEIGIVSADPG